MDTYDVAEAVRTAVEVAGPELGAVRIDSGDLLLVAHRVRQQLDELGATGHPDRGHLRPGRVRHRLAGGGAGGRVRGGHPAGDRVAGIRPARWSTSWSPAPSPPTRRRRWCRWRRSPRGGKTSVGGRKWAARRLDAYGVAEAEVVGTGPVPDELADRQLLVELVKGGEVVAPRAAGRGA